MEFWEEGGGVEFLKAGFLGFAKSGKTYTATLLAIATRKLFGVEAPIAFYDTEGGASYVAGVVEQLTGKKLLVKRSRSFDDMMVFAREVEKLGAVAIVDSITAPWRELCDSYLAQKNAARAAKRRPPVTRLALGDWTVIKPEWAKWADFYSFSKLHLIICGRAGWEWEETTDDQGNEKLSKSGIKMKTEGEMGFEPSLLVEMQRDQDIGGAVTVMRRRATVLGDRFQVLDGKSFLFESSGDPEHDLEIVTKTFMPHLSRLRPGTHSPVNIAVKTDFKMDDEGDSQYYREKRERVILAEEAQGALTAAYPGQTTVEKKTKADLLQECYGTRSWTAVESMGLDALREGLKKLRAAIERKAAVAPAEEKEHVNA